MASHLGRSQSKIYPDCMCFDAIIGYIYGSPVPGLAQGSADTMPRGRETMGAPRSIRPVWRDVRCWVSSLAARAGTGPEPHGNRGTVRSAGVAITSDGKVGSTNLHGREPPWHGGTGALDRVEALLPASMVQYSATVVTSSWRGGALSYKAIIMLRCPLLSYNVVLNNPPTHTTFVSLV